MPVNDDLREERTARIKLHAAKKGEVRNPAGRPKHEVPQSVIKRLLQTAMKKKDPFSELPQKLRPLVTLTVQEILVIAQIQKAFKGDTNAFNALMDRGYGKVALKAEISINAAHNLRYESLEDIQAAIKEADEELIAAQLAIDAEDAEYVDVKS